MVEGEVEDLDLHSGEWDLEFGDEEEEIDDEEVIKIKPSMVGVVVADASVPEISAYFLLSEGYRHIQDGQELSAGYKHIQNGEDLVVTRQQAKVLMFRLSLYKVHVRAPSQLKFEVTTKVRCSFTANTTPV